MKLPNGITGFYNSEANKPPQINKKQFKQLCFYYVLSNGGKVMNFNNPKYAMNFYYAKVEVIGDLFYILLNKHYPFLAFASVVEFGNIKFIDIPNFYETYFGSYQVLRTVELNTPLSQNLVSKSELNAAELKQFTYWKPITLGEVIFNYWD